MYRLNRKEYERQEKIAEDKEYVIYQKQLYEQNYYAQISKTLAECMMQIFQYEQKKLEYEKALEYYIIKADTSGYVTKVIMDNPQELPLSVGMSGSAELVIGTRNAMEYFLEPVTQGVNESFREK